MKGKTEETIFLFSESKIKIITGVIAIGIMRGAPLFGLLATIAGIAATHGTRGTWIDNSTLKMSEILRLLDNAWSKNDQEFAKRGCFDLA